MGDRALLGTLRILFAVAGRFFPYVEGDLLNGGHGLYFAFYNALLYFVHRFVRTDGFHRNENGIFLLGDDAFLGDGGADLFERGGPLERRKEGDVVGQELGDDRNFADDIRFLTRREGNVTLAFLYYFLFDIFRLANFFFYFFVGPFFLYTVLFQSFPVYFYLERRFDR